MILVKTTVDEKEYYKEVSEDRICEYEGEEVIYVDEDSCSGTRHTLEFSNGDISLESHGKSFDVSGIIRNAGSVYNLFKARFDDIDHKIMEMLPFLDEDDIHKVVSSIISGENDLSNRKVVSMLPFMKQDDCDALFDYYLNDRDKCSRLTSFGPFVSDECLSRFVGNYISGKFSESEIEVSALYPFMNSDDVRRLFLYYTSK